MPSPRVSLFIFCYQQAEFIEQALHAALAQDYDNLQIVISDDCSADDTYLLIQKLTTGYSGRHQLTINRNQKNLGIGRHFMHIMNHLIDGELVVASAGDDISTPNRVSRIVEEWLAHGKPAMVAHGLEEIDEQGQLFCGSRTVQYRLQQQPVQWPAQMALHQYLQDPFPLPYIGAALAYRRDQYLEFGSPDAEPAYEDHLMYFRSLLTDALHYFPEVLVKYRRHANNFTARPARPKLLHIPDLFRQILPEQVEFAADKVGIFRLHQLTTQQWRDYRHAINTGKITADFALVTALWQQLSWRHSRLLQLKGGFKAWLHLCVAVSQVYDQARRYLGRRVYLYPDKLCLTGYAPPFRTVVFGAGSGGEQLLANLCGGFQVVAICDNNSKLHGQLFCGLPVISPQQLKDDICTIDCVMVASTFFYEIKAKLTEEQGIPAEKISRAPYAAITRLLNVEPGGAVTSVLLISALLGLLMLLMFGWF